MLHLMVFGFYFATLVKYVLALTFSQCFTSPVLTQTFPKECSCLLLFHSRVISFCLSIITETPLVFDDPPLEHSSQPLLFHIKLYSLHLLLKFCHSHSLLSLLYNVLLMESQNIASITLRLFNLVLFFSSAFL